MFGRQRLSELIYNKNIQLPLAFKDEEYTEMIEEEQISEMSPAQLRLAEAKYFYLQFLRHSRSGDCYFLMVSYFDSYLFALISIEEMVVQKLRLKLYNIPEFAFLKELRNINTHHSVLAAVTKSSKFSRPFSRHIDVGGPQGDSSELFFKSNVLRAIFDEIEKEHKEKNRSLKSLNAARTALDLLEQEAPGELGDIMKKGLDKVSTTLTSR